MLFRGWEVARYVPDPAIIHITLFWVYTEIYGLMSLSGILLRRVLSIGLDVADTTSAFAGLTKVTARSGGLFWERPDFSDTVFVVSALSIGLRVFWGLSFGAGSWNTLKFEKHAESDNSLNECMQ